MKLQLIFMQGCWLGAGLLCLTLADPGSAREPAVTPAINRAFAAPEFDRWVTQFERPGREVYDRRHEIVAATGVRPGMVVADIGAGTGLFTRLFSQRVGAGGQVYAVDISAVFIENITRISAGLGQWNVVAVRNSAEDVSLPPQSIDLAFICDTYHHFEKPDAMMKSVRRALKPGGSVVVIDFRKIRGFSTPWVMSHVRADASAVIDEIESNGFRLVERNDLLRTNYFLRFALVE